MIKILKRVAAEPTLTQIKEVLDTMPLEYVQVYFNSARAEAVKQLTEKSLEEAEWVLVSEDESVGFENPQLCYLKNKSSNQGKHFFRITECCKRNFSVEYSAEITLGRIDMEFVEEYSNLFSLEEFQRAYKYATDPDSRRLKLRRRG